MVPVSGSTIFFSPSNSSNRADVAHSAGQQQVKA